MLSIALEQPRDLSTATRSGETNGHDAGRAAGASPEAAPAARRKTTTRAIVRDRYGSPDVLEMREIEMPAVREDEVLVRVVAAAVCGDDWHLMRGLPYAARVESGLFAPRRKTMGLDVAGRVEAVGAKVTQFRPGDEVFGWAPGSYAEYVAVPESSLAHRPVNIGLEQAAAVPISGFTALQAVRDRGEVRPGQHVLINGASGGVGTFAVQIARALGAVVTGVCSTRNLELVRSLGADHVIDYTKEDFTRLGRQYDVIVDLAQSCSLAELRRALTPTGTLVLVGSSGKNTLTGRNRWFKGTDRWISALFLSLFTRQRLRPLIHQDRKEDLLFLKELIEAGEVTPVIDRTYPLHDAAAAIRRTEAGGVRGKLVITV